MKLKNHLTIQQETADNCKVQYLGLLGKGGGR